MAMYVLQALIKDLVQFTSGENASPSGQWTVQHSLRLLQQYPAGISKAVLLTELDYLWKIHQKRGEHVGKLKQAITTKQLSLADILTGDLTAIDEYRFVPFAAPTTAKRRIVRKTNTQTIVLYCLGVALVQMESLAV